MMRASGARRFEVGFREAFATEPAFLVQAPGRVNLIGEHVDYCGLPVLPIAIDRRITIFGAPRRDDTVRLVTANGYPPREFRLASGIPPYAPGDWGNYPKAAAAVLFRQVGALRGFNGLVASDLPAAAGLSSSAALVVAVALALMHVNGLTIEWHDLADLLAEGERYVGTRGGGMDQAVCLLGRHGTASRVEFEPLRLTMVPVPSDWRFIVADTREPAEKSGAALETYNRRTEEVNEARGAVGEALGVPDVTWRELIEGDTTSDLLAAARGMLDETLLRRFRHVVTESDRVIQAERALLSADLLAFGGLLQDSHASLRDDYEVSTPRLDRLAELAVARGATGARLTGAGLGGCIMAACDVGRAPGILAALEKEFYQTLGDPPGPPEARLFAVEAAGGATVRAL